MDGINAPQARLNILRFALLMLVYRALSASKIPNGYFVSINIFSSGAGGNKKL